MNQECITHSGTSYNISLTHSCSITSCRSTMSALGYKCSKEMEKQIKENGGTKIMCMAKVAVLRTMLGNREIGYELWNTEKGEVAEMTAKEIKAALLKDDPIYGLVVGKDDELELDGNFFMRNLMEHRHVSNYTPMIEDETCVANVAYIVTGKSDNGYEIISTKWERKVVTEEMLKMFLSMGLVFGGAKLEDDKVVLPDLERKAPKAEKKAEPVKAAETKMSFGKLFGGGFVVLFGAAFRFKQCDGQTARL